MDIVPDIDRARAPPRQRRTRTRPSILKCLGVGCLVVAGIVTISFGWFFSTALWELIQNARFPHKDLYHPVSKSSDHNSTANVLTTGNPPVGPLLDRDTKFDVALTIFARIPDDEVDPSAAAEEESASRERYGSTLASVKSVTHMPEMELLRRPKEQVLYSEVIMRDMELRKGRGMGAVDVEFELPLRRFYDRLVYSTDIRGSLFIVPHSPSSFDRVVNHTDWRGEGAGPLPRISDDLASQLLTRFSPAQRTLLDHIAVAFTLLQLHPASDAATKTSSSVSAEPRPSAGSAASPSEEAEREPKSVGETETGVMTENQEMYLASEDELELHMGEDKSGYRKEVFEKRLKVWKEDLPYFLTRSHIYIVDETNHFNRTSFDRRHESVRSGSCGQGMALPATRFLCVRNYPSNGQWETRAVLASAPASDALSGTSSDSPSGDVQDVVGDLAEDGDEQEDVAYGPYLGALKHMAGPKDLLPLPVIRGRKFNPAKDLPTIKVKHHLTLSALTPGRLNALDSFVPATTRNASDTDAHRVEAHATWEQISGLLGNKLEGTHPWRRFVLGFISDAVLSLLIGILTPLYWYTRQTTTGIHLLSAILFGAQFIIDDFVFLLLGAMSKISWGQYITQALFSSLDVAVGVIVLWAVWPLEWPSWGRLRLVRWGKRERVTRRMEGQVGMGVWGVIFIALFAFCYLTGHYKLYLVTPLHIPPPPPVGESIRKPPILHAALWALLAIARIMQYDLNSRSGSFAGSYALTAYLDAAKHFVEILYFFEPVVGRPDTRSGISWMQVLDMVLVGVGAWQAWRWARVEQTVPGDEDE